MALTKQPIHFTKSDYLTTGSRCKKKKKSMLKMKPEVSESCCVADAIE